MPCEMSKYIILPSEVLNALQYYVMLNVKWHHFVASNKLVISTGHSQSSCVDDMLKDCLHGVDAVHVVSMYCVGVESSSTVCVKWTFYLLNCLC